MLTSFGKELRKYRIDNDILLGEMASKIGVSASFLSSVETGKKKLTEKIINNIFSAYEIKDETKSIMSMCARNTMASQNKITVYGRDEDKELVAQFARELPTTSDEIIRKILEQLKS